MADEFKPRDCPACEQPTDTLPLPAYSTDEWRLGSCQSCGFVYLLNPPATSALVDEFAFEKTYAQQRVRRRSSSRAAAAWDSKSAEAAAPDWFRSGRSAVPFRQSSGCWLRVWISAVAPGHSFRHRDIAHFVRGSEPDHAITRGLLPACKRAGWIQPVRFRVL